MARRISINEIEDQCSSCGYTFKKKLGTYGLEWIIDKAAWCCPKCKEKIDNPMCCFVSRWEAGKLKCDECTCTYESCSCKLPGSKCAYETDDKKDDGARENEKR